MKQIIVFDFDGVIVLGSERIKQRCWLDLFRPLGEKALIALTKAIERYSQGRGSRYDIVRDTLNDLGISKEKIPGLIESYCSDYAQKVQAGILAEGIRSEDKRALDYLAQRATLFINTATPQPAIEEILENLHINHLFKNVYGPSGSNLGKVEILQLIFKDESVAVKDIVFMGDGEGDRRAAAEAGCRFIGVCDDNKHWIEKRGEFRVFNSIFEATRHLFPDFPDHP